MLLSAWLSPQTDSMAAANASCLGETIVLWYSQSSLDDQQGHPEVAQASLNTFSPSSIHQTAASWHGSLPSAMVFAGKLGEGLETVIVHDDCLFGRLA